MQTLTKDDLFSEKELTEIVNVKDKFEHYLKTLKFPIQLADMLRQGIVTGGASASLFHGDAPKDWDIYLTTQQSIDEFNNLAKREDVLALIEDINPKYGVDSLVDGKLITPRAVTFKNGVQVITMARSDARETFDFIHCMPYFDLNTKQYHISRNQYDSIKQKKLVHNPKSPQPATYRRQKFLNRGWHD